MPIYRCKCGAKYKIPESAVGRRVRCKKCDHLFTVPKAEPEIIPFAVVPEEETGTFAPQFESSPDHPDDGLAPAPIEVRAEKGYAQSVLWAFLFLSQPGNLITFFFLWFIFVLAGYAPLAVVVTTLLGFWYASYKFSLILSGAAGEEELPEIKYAGDVLDELIIPALKWFIGWLFVMMPLLVYLITNMVNGSISGQIIVPLVFGGTGGLLSLASDPWIPILVVVGTVIWPISILCVTIGGLGTLLRFDLMLVTMVKSFGGYIVTLILLGIAAGIAIAFELYLTPAGGSPFSADAIINNAIKVGINLYLDIVLMRIIGLYYRHFKNKFAWDWG